MDLNRIFDRCRALLRLPARDIDTLIERIGQRHRPADRRRAYELFLDGVLYAPVVAVPQSSEKKKKKAAGKKKKAASKKKSSRASGLSVPAGDQIVSLALAGVNDYQMLLLYTRADDPRLAQYEHRLSLPGRRAFEMALASGGVDGVLIHNCRSAWMALPEVLVQEVLAAYPAGNNRQ